MPHDDDDTIDCCILGVCCWRRRDAEAALAKLLAHASTPEAQAALIFERFDLVPKGLGEAIVAAYRDHFATAQNLPYGEASPNRGPEEG